jgi:hypothetical protein
VLTLFNRLHQLLAGYGGGRAIPNPPFSIRIDLKYHERLRLAADRLREGNQEFEARFDALVVSNLVTLDAKVAAAVQVIEQARDAALVAIQAAARNAFGPQTPMSSTGVVPAARPARRTPSVLTPILAEKIIGLARTGMGRHAIRKTTGLGGSIIAAVLTPWIEAGRPEDAGAVIVNLMVDRERGRLRSKAGKPVANREVIIGKARRLRAEGLSLDAIGRRLEVSAGWVGRVTRTDQ